MVDRKLLKNPNGLILGTPGSGKSFSAKREIANCFLLTSDDVIICDPEAEYAPLVERLHGQVIKISPTSTNYINPMDLNLDYSDDESPLSLKSDFILSLCELIVGGKDGLQPVQKTIIDRCVRLVYQDYLNDPRPENMPILEDLYDAEIRKVKNAYAAVTAQAKLKQEEQARQSNRQEIVHSIAEADALTSELTDLLIEKVYVFPNNCIEIVYRVHDLFE